DFNREAVVLGDAPGDAGDARGDPGHLRGDRPPGRHEARRGDPQREAGGADARARPRDPRSRLADAGPLPLRRLLAPERRPDADSQGEDRALPVSRVLHDRLMAELEQRGDRTPIPAAWEYASAPESREIVKLEERYGLFIGGEFVEPRSGEHYKTLDPSSEEPLAEIPQAGPEDVALAVGTAREAFSDGWSAASPAERAKYLFRIARILQERSREFAVLESLNGGKPIRESRDVDLPLAAAHFFYYAGWADKLEYAFPHRRPQPLGVAGQIIPWNFPLLMLAWKIAPALAGGNTVVLKPAETTPLSALLFCDVLRQAELPPGVVNIVTGDGSTGAALVTHDGVDKIAFTGSTEVGKAIQRELACTLPEKGYWFVPTVFTNVAQSYRIAQEEIFGPVLSVLTFRTPEEAVEKANNTMYGLSAGVWTEKGSRILWMAQRLRAGVVWANTFNRFDPSSPFGGYKESGFGREGGLHGLEPYLAFDDSETFGG